MSVTLQTVVTPWKVRAAAPSLTLKDVVILTVINNANVALWHRGT